MPNKKEITELWDGKTSSLVNNDELEVRVWLLSDQAIPVKGTTVKVIASSSQRISCRTHDGKLFSLPLSFVVFEVRKAKKVINGEDFDG